MASASKKLFKGSVLRSFTLVVNILIGFFMMPFMIHSLGDDQYGLWVLVGAIIGFYGLLDAGFGSAIIRFIVRAMHGEDDKKDVNVALSSSIFLFSGIGLLSLVITFIIIMLVPQFTDSEVNESLAKIMIGILGLKVSILFPLSSFGGVLMARYRFDILSYIRLFSLAFRTSLIVGFVSYGYDIVAVAVITSVDAVLASVITVIYAKKLFPELKVSISLISLIKLRQYYDYGKYTYITTIADRIRFSIDDLVVAGFIGAAAVTHYTIAVALVRYFGEFMDGVLGVISPLLNKYHKLDQWDNLREVFLVATDISVMLSVLIGGLLILLGEPFIIIWVGEEYTDVYIVLLLLSVSSVVANAQRPSVTVLFAIAKHKFYAKITSIEAAFNITISVVLVQYIGIYGVALGTVIPLLFNKLFMQPVYTCKQLDVSLKNYYFILVRFFTAGVLLFAPLFLLSKTVDFDSYLKLIVFAGLASFAYVVISLKFLFKDETVSYIKGVLPENMRFIMNYVS